MQTLETTESGASINLAVTSVSTLILKIDIPVPPVFTELSQPVFDGCVQEELLTPKNIQIVDDEGRIVTMEVSRSPYAWKGTYLPIGRRLWRKLEVFSERDVNTRQLDLWQEEEEEEGAITVLIEVTPLLHPTNQIVMLWVARLELRKRIWKHFRLI